MNTILAFKKLTLIAVCVMGSALISQPASAKGVEIFKTKQNPSYNQIELLFYQRAEAGSVKIHAGLKQCYDLTLLNLSPHVIYFANYPAQQAGQMQVAHYANSIEHTLSTSSVKPHAILHAHIHSKDAKPNDESTIINRPVEIRASAYHASQQKMVYLVCDLENNQASLSYSLKHIDLFVDPFHRWPP